MRVMNEQAIFWRDSINMRDMDKIDQVCAMAGVHSYTIMRSEISAILEKTKEYAE